MRPQLGAEPQNFSTLASAFARFLQHGKFLKNWSPKTERSYRQAFKSLQMASRERDSDTSAGTVSDTSGILTKGHLEAWVISMRQRGLSPGACNVYIRGINSFLSWLHAEGELPAPLRLSELAAKPKELTTFTDAHLRAILAFKPRGFCQMRTWVLICLLTDTGCRIDELLTLRREDVDMDNLLLTVTGKGSKIRKVPFSHEMRRVLFRFAQALGRRGIQASTLFCTRTGAGLRYRNAYRDIKLLCEDLGIQGPRISPHTFRHTFATNFIKSGGDIYTLSRILGHSSVQVTSKYLHLVADDLKAHHQKHSILARLRT
jgi:integrase/recombinase XerD